MSSTIDFGIDLGTTNSLIAKFVKGEVEVFRDPGQGRETLPSVVGFRKERILIGSTARQFAEKDPKNVLSRFKRRMGTPESYRVPSLGQTKTPIELSKLVLQELKSFVHTGETVNAAVITVPASFDSMQSNATKEAGLAAGLQNVTLLAEPIAASLAYANKRKERDLRDSQWLVYDLGGGTFDVALVRIINGELKVIDHEGDNFLGGTDFDELIVKKLLIPRIAEEGDFDDLEGTLTSDSGSRNKLWYTLLHAAEEAKILLSTKSSTDIEIEIADDNDAEIEMQIPLTRSEFDGFIRSSIDRTAEMIRTILTRNALRPTDLQFILMVGGSTYIPFVRRRIEELLQIPVNCDINPITAVVIGAAYFAGSREKKSLQESSPSTKRAVVRVKAVYNRATQDAEEIFSARVEGAGSGWHFRITRQDGGYDSGLKNLTGKISEDLPLQTDAYNLFTLHVLDQQGNPVPHDAGTIQIAHGKYSVAGQSVPHDICLVVDDLARDRTKLVELFSKNQVLPAKKSIIVSANTTVIHGSTDQILHIIVKEGDASASPEANLTIGHIKIIGKQINRDLIKGTDIELVLELSESRELNVSAYITSTNDAFAQTFAPEKRAVSLDTLPDEVFSLHDNIEREISEARNTENYEAAAQLDKLQRAAVELGSEITLLSTDDVTDDRYKLEDRKRKLAGELDRLTRNKQIDRLRAEYKDEKDKCEEIIKENGNDHERRRYTDILQQEPAFLSSENPMKIQPQIDALVALRIGILRRTPSFLVSMFDGLAAERQRLNDQAQAKSLIDAGRLAVKEEQFDRLDEIICGLINLLPNEEILAATKTFVGISSQ